MKQCLLCGQDFIPAISLLQVFSWRQQNKQCICPNCLNKFRLLTEPTCPICSVELSSTKICTDCLTWQKSYGNQLLRNYALYRYNQAFHDLMVNYKRYGDFVLRLALAQLCALPLAKIKADFYVPLPTSPEHLQKRQFDTVMGIYQDVVPLTPLLVTTGGFGAQGEKNRQERLARPQSFSVVDQAKADLNHHKVLLLDDIYTTGRTLYHARDAILAVFPQAKIESFTICR
ncbi:double zinc ribbon domain-containing protein [Lactobacillus sp. ESL0681]|uniref:ComF family protein n=1 Tax=Lactobacillus sp. ESL0681 TaxID=2983211 RepID=UPI0023F6F3A7|nr:double zinc ribbon domain-containing protein [Lactobacillus sp. ESL0681]WEV40433.1 double zinc ribbon domain-containing protein [Lactobacillus sp. ESL0681]